jgi:putative toxin-antitoxin system antitoxin component (TIGR02293 family)
MATPAQHLSTQNLYQRIASTLGIKSVRSDADLIHCVEARLPVRTITALIKGGLTEEEIYSLVIPRRTLSHRKAKRDPLTREESDRAVRVGRVLALAEGVFGEKSKALSWLRKPKRHFENRPALELLSTDAAVEELLYQIDYGMAA